MTSAGLAKFLEQVVTVGGVVPKFVRLINDDEVVFLRVADFVQAAVVQHPDCIIQSEPFHFRFPILPQRGRRDDEDARAVAGKPVVVKEFFSDASRHDGFAQAHHVGEKKAAMLLELEPAVVHRVALVAQRLDAFRQIRLRVRVVVDGRAEVFGEEFDVEFKRREVLAQITFAHDTRDRFGQNGDAFPPQLFKFVPRKHHVVVVVKQDVELVIALGVLRAESGGGEVRRTGDDGARLVLAKAARQKNVNLGVQALGAVGANLDAFGRHVGNELADAVLDFFAVGCALHIRFDLLPHGGHGFVRIAQQQKTLAVLRRQLRVHIDADEDADQWDFFQMWPEREVTRRPQIAHQCVEPLKVGIVGEDTCKLFQQRVLAFVGEEAGGHSIRTGRVLPQTPRCCHEGKASGGERLVLIAKHHGGLLESLCSLSSRPDRRAIFNPTDLEESPCRGRREETSC